MNKQLLIVKIIAFFLIIGLSGCLQTNNNSTWANKVEIVSYSVGTYLDAGKLIANGFIYNESARFYLVNGTAKNIAGKLLYRVVIIVKFYDSNDTLLREESSSEFNIEKDMSWDFQGFYLSDWPYFADVNHMEFDISITE